VPKDNKVAAARNNQQSKESEAHGIGIPFLVQRSALKNMQHYQSSEQVVSH